MDGDLGSALGPAVVTLIALGGIAMLFGADRLMRLAVAGAWAILLAAAVWAIALKI